MTLLRRTSGLEARSVRDNAFRLGARFGLGPLQEAALVAATFLMLILMVYPTLWIFVASFRTPETMFAAQGAVWTFGNYVALCAGGFIVFIVNSLVTCVAAVVLSTIVAIHAAYALSRYRFPGRNLVLNLVLLGQAFPWIILVTPLFILAAQFGLTNNRAVMILLYAAIATPFSIYLLVGYLESIPRTLDEAALIDGCSAFGIVWRIILPVALPGVVATMTYAFLLTWTEYLLALALLTETEVRTMPLELYAFFGDYGAEWGKIMAASALTTLPALLLFLPVQSRLTAGLAAGAVKQ